MNFDKVGTERNELLERARNHCFFFDVGDTASLLCRLNMPYGIAKLLYLQRTLGLPEDACFISTTDSTITRNIRRWQAGFGYGGRVDWGSGFIPLEVKPNCCGVIVVGLDRCPDVDEVRRKVSEASRKPGSCHGIEFKWDFGISNHFINLYEVETPSAAGGYRYVGMLHGSGEELRGETRLGPGLYLEKNPGLLSKARRADTPFGPLHILEDAAADEYLQFNRTAVEFAKTRRQFYAGQVFPGAKVLFNEMHQGMWDFGSVLLGCYSESGVDGNPPWYPLTLRAELPAYLIARQDVYAEDVLRSEGAWEQATAAGLSDRLCSVNILAHGGGYSLNGVADVEIEDNGAERSYRMLPQDIRVTHVRKLDYSYRGTEVLSRLKQLRACRVVTELKPIVSVKEQGSV